MGPFWFCVLCRNCCSSLGLPALSELLSQLAVCEVEMLDFREFLFLDVFSVARPSLRSVSVELPAKSSSKEAYVSTRLRSGCSSLPFGPSGAFSRSSSSSSSSWASSAQAPSLHEDRIGMCSAPVAPTAIRFQARCTKLDTGRGQSQLCGNLPGLSTRGDRSWGTEPCRVELVSA